MTAGTEPGDYYRPSQDERTFACISHLTIFVSSIGLLIAIGLWLYLRRRQPYAGFQAAQAVLFQVVVVILTLILVAGLLIVIFGAFGVGAVSGVNLDDTALGILVAVIAILFMIVLGIFTLALYIYAIFAAVRSYQGRPFQIPGVASIAEAMTPMPRVHPEGSSGR